MSSLSSKISESNLFSQLRLWTGVVLFISISLELILFPSFENFLGCLMTFIVYWIFLFFLRRGVILNNPFSFLVYSSFFLARFIPLPATLLEGKPITYGFEAPYDTFLFETLMFVVCSVAFYFSTHIRFSNNTILQKLLLKMGFFHASPTILWLMGFVGVLVRIQQLIVAGDVEFGDVNNKFLAGMIYFQYAPILLLFPSLSRIVYKKKNLVLFYLAAIFIISFATNSRQAMIFPIFTIFLLFFLTLVKDNLSVFHYIKPQYVILIFISCFFLLNLVSDISLAMLANRGLRDDISRLELFSKTIETLQDDQVMNSLRQVSILDKGDMSSYYQGWDENYLDNFMLNRFGNLRVSDQVLYYANEIGYANSKMLDSFSDKFVAIFPTPLANLFDDEIDKNQLDYSPGDMIYQLGSRSTRFVLGTHRVSSLVGDGLATFGFLCFPLFFFLLFFSFKLLDNLVYFKDGDVFFSILSLIIVFDLFGVFRNSIGSINLFFFLFRGFWQYLVTYFVVYKICWFCSKVFFSSKMYN
ncbi:hypothetical protein J0A68_21000 [Algoriphagus sp. H41]|uniref:O-Antigen ligase n=1 Tax=Algoriphagus oliviformis TaxID=2811231 RepID=A0ABS3C8M8_9BACT|nr:hypothetical protein [Algoriphagus oliviformis]MBN7813447.1 hypothetical protein [Algoriphagus oliviformis]